MPPVTLNVTHPEKVIGLHKAYIHAGAEALLTTTFGAVFDNLHYYLPESITSPADVVIFNKIAARRAREAAGNTAYVIGSMAPLAQEVAYELMVAAYLPQARGLFEAGVDGIAVETAYAPAMFAAAVEAWNTVDPNGAIPLGITASFDMHDEDGEWFTMNGLSPQGLGLFALGAQSAGRPLGWIGHNCGEGYEGVGDIARTFNRYFPDIPLWVKPNAGLPVYENEKTTTYPEATVDQAYACMQAALGEGACAFGLCCGSNPKLMQTLYERYNNEHS